MGYYDNYLEHHGIKGMHWGVRRFEKAGGGLTPAGKKRYADSDVVTAKKTAKAEYKTAKKDFNKSFNTAYAHTGPHITKKGKERNQKEWEDTYDKQNTMESKRKAYSKAKEAYKEKYNENLAKARQNASTKDKLLFNDATRKRAAKIMTDHKNVSLADAQNQANKEALRNTAIILGAYGAMTLGAVALSKR